MSASGDPTWVLWIDADAERAARLSAQACPPGVDCVRCPDSDAGLRSALRGGLLAVVVREAPPFREAREFVDVLRRGRRHRNVPVLLLAVGPMVEELPADLGPMTEVAQDDAPLAVAGRLRGFLTCRPRMMAQADLESEVVAARRAVAAAEERRAESEAEAENLRATMAEVVSSRTRDLERANGMLLAFARSAAHDLWAPLRTIVGMGHALCEDLDAGKTTEARKLAERVLLAGQRMSALLEGTLRYCIASAERPPARMIELDEVVREVVEALTPSLDGGEIHVGPLPAVHCDRASLTVVLQNLLSNALKYRGPSLPRLAVVATREADFVHVTVSDNGPGIDPEDAEHLFEPFARGAGVARVEGAGLGLAICRRMVEASGGRIWSESTPGEGARFTFTVPAAPPKR